MTDVSDPTGFTSENAGDVSAANCDLSVAQAASTLGAPVLARALDIVTNPSIKLAMAVKQAVRAYNSPAMAGALKLARDSSIKRALNEYNGYVGAVKLASDPSIKRAMDAFNSPAMAGVLKLASNPSLKRAMDAYNSPAVAGALKLASDPSIKRAMDTFNSPAMAGVLKLASNPSLKRAMDVYNSPAAAGALKLASDPSIKRAMDVLKTPAWISAVKLANDPSVKLAMEALKTPVWARGFSATNNPSVRLAVEALKAPGWPEALDAFGNQGLISEDASDDPMSALSAASAEFKSEMSEAEFVAASLSYLEQVAQIIRNCLPTLQSLPALLGFSEHIILLVATVLAAYYASQSATSSDIERLKASTDYQTQVIESAGLRIETKFQEVLSLADQLIKQRLSEIAPRHLYIARRSINAKAAKSMKAPITGTIMAGSTAAVLRFDRKWIEVEFLDLLSGKPSRGWITKKNFRRQI